MAIVHGYISSLIANGIDAELDGFNHAVLETLPICGAYICRDMFSILPFANRAICKNGHIIHFASNVDEMYVMLPEWMAEFEELLSRLCWTSATVIETWCGHRFEWLAEHPGGIALQGVKRWSRRVFTSYHDLPEIDYGKGEFGEGVW